MPNKITFWNWLKTDGWKSYLFAFIIMVILNIAFVIELPQLLIYNSALIAGLGIGIIGAFDIAITIHFIKTFNRWKKYHSKK